MADLINSGAFNLGAASSDNDTTGASRPMRRWGGITGRSITTTSGSEDIMENTGIVTLAELYQSKLSEPTVVTSLTAVASNGVSYWRSSGEGTAAQNHTVSVPTGAISGDILVLSLHMDRSSAAITSGLSGWTLAGVNVGNERPGSAWYYRSYDGTGSPWSVSWSTDKNSWATMTAFRPNGTVSNLSHEQFNVAYADAASVTNSITSVATTNAPGGRIYFYAASGQIDGGNVTDPTTSISPSTGWTEVSGQGVVTGNVNNYAYKIDSAGTAFTSTTITTSSATDRFTTGFFVLNVT